MNDIKKYIFISNKLKTIEYYNKEKEEGSLYFFYKISYLNLPKTYSELIFFIGLFFVNATLLPIFTFLFDYNISLSLIFSIFVLNFIFVIVFDYLLNHFADERTRDLVKFKEIFVASLCFTLSLFSPLGLFFLFAFFKQFLKYYDFINKTSRRKIMKVVYLLNSFNQKKAESKKELYLKNIVNDPLSIEFLFNNQHKPEYSDLYSIVVSKVRKQNEEKALLKEHIKTNNLNKNVNYINND